MNKHILVLGAGHAGLVSAVLWARSGNFVSVYEKDEPKREAIASGKMPFHERGLDRLLSEVIQAERLRVVTDPEPAAAVSDFCFVTTETPVRRDGSVNLSRVLSACAMVARGIAKSSHYHVVVIRSTVSPGTTSDLVRKTLERASGKRAGQDFGLAAYPEFLREGSAIQDMIHPDRVVLGVLDDRSGNALEAFVRGFYQIDPPPIIRTTVATAEMIKYASNAFLAAKIAFMNEIASLCERMQDVDIRQVADGMGYDHRIGRALLNAGLGFGGPCLPKDLKALLGSARHLGIRLRIAEATLESNRLQDMTMIRLARESIGTLKGKNAAVLGLAYKSGTDDVRGAQSLKLVRRLLDAGMRVTVYDPLAKDNAAAILGRRVTYAKDVRECLEDADCCFVMTDWKEFNAISSDQLAETMAEPVVIDCRQVLRLSKLDERISYRAVGIKRGR